MMQASSRRRFLVQAGALSAAASVATSMPMNSPRSLPTAWRSGKARGRRSRSTSQAARRRACLVLGQHRNTRRRQRHVPDDEPGLVTRIVWLACEYGRYGYRRITALLHWEGWRVNHKRVERIWREEGLKVPKKQPKRRRLWFSDGSCFRLRPTHRDHVWSYCLVADRTSDGRTIRMLTAGSHGRVHSGVPVDRCRQEAHERGRS
jgi:hypothetical protein